MPNPLGALSAYAEHAVADIRLIVHQHIAARVNEDHTHIGRFGGPHTGYGDRATQFAVANIVGVVEHYAEQVLLGAGADPKKIRTWDDKTKEWTTRFGLTTDIATACPAFEPMRGYYEARNAIMHRRGELTDNQRKDAVYARLAAAAITLVGFNVVVHMSTIHACAHTCIICIEQLDATT